MRPGTDAAQVPQRLDHADHAVAAHPQIAGVVEEEDGRGAFGIERRLQHGADHPFGAARFADQRGSQPVVSLP